MLTLTPNASAVVKQISADTGEDGGLRISQASASEPALDVAAAPGPEPADQVVEAEGARVFLEETAAATLDDKQLDAQVDQNGGVEFSISMQGDDA